MELQMRIITSFLLMVSSAAEEVTSELKGVEGGSVTFPDPVMETGFFSYERTTVAIVKDRKFEIFGEAYEDRIFWNNQTGLFTIRGLRRTDSGVYTVDSKKGTVFTRSHKLTVYEPVAAPEVKAVNVSKDNCTLICSVKKAEAMTLLWYKEGKILKQSSLALSLPLIVQDFTSAYSCVAANPAEKKTFDVNATSVCSSSNNVEPPSDTRTKNLIAIPIVLAVIAVLALFIGWKYFIKNKKTNETQGRQETHQTHQDRVIDPT
ncbi:uncharacterized protein LOC121508904 isoform X2 [Cheilinus undulatus]|uniref:uncharacterized protein LOC121508904 isoform X2 n=1 Tax=Cheilinus undulatus TaxID=241271 RepID=UPI001BD36F61|nr:uncharacterized protein LOC121508904 isoform X2 [Cheilinus undulatus]